MKKNNNRKGFTTVELVIVIAVIAILATVLIPTFSGLIGKANDSAALQTARNAQTAIMNQDIMPNDNFKLAKDEVAFICINDTYWFAVVEGQLYTATYTAAAGETPASISVKIDTNTTKTCNNLTDIDETKIADLPDDATVFVGKFAA